MIPMPIKRWIELEPIKYVNLMGRICNEAETLNWYEKHGFFVAEQDGFVIPSDEDTERFLEDFELYLKERVHNKEIEFGGIPKRQYKMLSKEYDVIWDEFCWLYYYKDKIVEGLTDQYEANGSLYELDQLNMHDALQVFQHYTYKEDGIAYIEHVIDKHPTLCARVNGQLASWVVQRGDGSMGIMYTMPSHRRLGLGEWLSKHLMNLILEKDEIPYLHIIKENHASIALAESLGFKRHSEVVWFGIQNPYYRFRRDVILNAHEITTLFSKHLKAIDEHLKEMIKLEFNHASIHKYRECIRLFRALLYFYKPAMRPGDYRFLEMQSKRYFEKTSLIREIEVFESGYGSYMTSKTLENLQNLKQPLMARLKLDARRLVAFKFSNTLVKLPYLNPESMKSYELDRQCELFEEFMVVDSRLTDYQEKYIHNKRMLSKKIRYIHEIIMPEDLSLKNMNEKLASFQVVAKSLHDTCVNLRIVGSYKLNDAALIEKLVEDHSIFTSASEKAFDELVEVMKRYTNKQ